MWVGFVKLVFVSEPCKSESRHGHEKILSALSLYCGAVGRCSKPARTRIGRFSVGMYLGCVGCDPALEARQPVPLKLEYVLL